MTRHPAAPSVNVKRDEQPLLVRRARRGVVRDEVAHAVDDPLAVDVLHGLHDVGVVAEHEVDVGRPHQRGAERALGGRRRRVVLVAPVQGDDHHLRPRARAAAASARMRVSSIGFERQGSPSGGGTPLKPNVYDSRATSAPSTGSSVVVAASAGVRADPAWATPAASRAVSVRSTPAAPRS